MSNTKVARRARVTVRRQWMVAALVTLGVACGGDEGEARHIPALGVDGSVLRADSGFPDPVVVPPPSNVSPPANDAGAAMQTGPIGGPMDGGAARFDAGARDAGVGAATDGGATSEPGDGNPCGTGPEPLAANVRISEVALYQTVKVSLYKNNAWPAMRNASVVQGKKSLLRAFVEPQTGYVGHALRGVLTLDTDGKKTVLASDRMISRASTDDAADSTFTFQVDGALIAGSTQLSVAVTETACMPPAANSAGARVPATGSQALNADAIKKFKVVVVPVTLGGRTPDTSAAQLTKMREELLAYYPVAEVEVTAHAPVAYSGAVASSGSGWSEVLSLVGRTRQQDAPATNVYYYGLITPAASFREYCRSGCVAGLAPQTTVVSRSNQIGLGVGFTDGNTQSTMAHELGHAHGLPHAPCTRGGTIQGADARFPYMGAKIGSWGWDSRSNKLMSPSTYVDLMSYCEPVWISDYNYAKITTRAKAVNNIAFVYQADQASAQSWRGIILHADGSARWSGMSADELPGEPSAAHVLNAQGAVLREIEVVRIALSHSDDSFLYVPENTADAVAIDLGDSVLRITDIVPAP